MSASQLLKQANQLKREKKWDEAIEVYYKVIKIAPNFAWAYLNLGKCFFEKGALDDAVNFYLQCLRIIPFSGWLFYSLGEALVQKGDLEGGVQYLQKALKIHPNHQKNYYILTWCLYQFKKSQLVSSTFSIRSKVIEPFKVLKLGKGWSENTINTVIFRHHAILTSGQYQFTAYYKNKQELQIVQRDLGTGSLISNNIIGKYNLQDAHNSISLGIDAEGYLHICYDHHGHSLRYRRSQKPMSIEMWTDLLPMTGNKEEKVTYPTFLINPVYNNLMFLYRYGNSVKGQACLKQYNHTLQIWQDLPYPILSGYEQRPWTSNPYWNHPIFDRTGQLHLSYVWRTHLIGKEKRVNNLGIDYAYSPDMGWTWFTSKGMPLDLPITQVNSETVWGIPSGANLINQTSMALTRRGNPHIVFYANDENDIPQYQHLWFDGYRWRHNFISRRTEKFDLVGKGTLQIPMSRPEIVIDKYDGVHVIYRADFTDHRMAVLTLFPDNYNFSDGIERILWSEPLGFAEPIIDRLRWKKENILSMLIQYNHQPQHDQSASYEETPVYLADWYLT